MTAQTVTVNSPDRFRWATTMSGSESLPATGRATFDTPIEAVTAGSYATIPIQYTVGRMGMDDGSSLLIAFSQTADWTRPQFDEPQAPGYTTVSTTGEATVSAVYDPDAWIRPMSHGVKVDVTDGSIEPGEEIHLVIGETDAGSLGQRQQSFPEQDFAIRVLADPVRTGEFVTVEELAFDVEPASATQLEAVVPATASQGETVTLSVRALDRWGNPDRDYHETVSVRGAYPELGDPEAVRIEEGVGHSELEVGEPGVYRIDVTDKQRGISAQSNPLVVREGFPSTYWGDIHGQSGETVGTGTIQEYFAFARDYGLVDFAAHAGNDFQITDDFWDEIRETVQAFHESGDFVTFPCWEWSGNTPMGGDHNVYFKNDAVAAEEPIRRSHDWLVTDDDQRRTDGTWPVSELYDAFSDREDVMIVPHQGGRPARLEDVDPAVSPGVEITSVWGVFEWFGRKAIERGLRPALFGGSDDHTGRPGIATPDNLPKHNVRGGLLAAQAGSLSRAALWDAFRSGRVSPTTGSRILLNVTVDGVGMGGELNGTAGESLDISGEVHGTAPIQRATLYRDGRPVRSRTFGDGSGEWITIAWEGAKGTGRDKVLDWSGGCTLTAGTFESPHGFGFDHPDQGIQRTEPTVITWSGTTTGNRQGVRFRMPSDANSPQARISTPQISASVDLSSLSDGSARTFEVPAGLESALEVRRSGLASDLDRDVAFTDAVPADGAAYHVRITQADGEMAWSSPVFVDTAEN